MVATLVKVAMNTGDGSECYDINESSTENHNCDVKKANCVNL